MNTLQLLTFFGVTKAGTVYGLMLPLICVIGNNSTSLKTLWTHLVMRQVRKLAHGVKISMM